MHPLFLLIILFLLLLTKTTATPTVGVTYNAKSPKLPPLSSIVTTLIHNKISTVHLHNPTPFSLNAFSNTNITLLVSIPNTFLRSFATNQSSSATWLTKNILPFHHTTCISLISIDSTTQITRFHLPALRNLYSSLRKLGIVNLPVSITFPLETILYVNDWFSPARAEFYEPLLIRPLVRFLKSTNSSFLVTVYPYKVYRSSYNEIPVLFALFQEHVLDIRRTDVVTGIEYWNLFDMMVDSLVFALDCIDEGNVRVVVAETGWPCKTIEVRSDGYWARLYLNGLMDHLKKSGSKRVNEVYVYELFGDEWGIMEKSLSFKYQGLDFSGSRVHEEVVMSVFVYKMALFGILAAFVLVLVIVVVGFREKID